MFKPKTFQHLCSAMQTGATVEIDDYIGDIIAIEREDGSGHNWNVTLYMHDGNGRIPMERVNLFFRES